MGLRPSRVAVTLAVGAAGYLALLARPAAAGGALVVDVIVGGIGLCAAVPPAAGAPERWTRWTAVTAIGVATFAAGRVLAPHHPPHVAWSLLAVAPPMVASVAEEAFFRRWLYGWLAAGGWGVAIVATAAAFAAVHVPAYGPQALPIDFAAGLVFGWQRAATGGWTAPALTHMAANLLQMS